MTMGMRRQWGGPCHFRPTWSVGFPVFHFPIAKDCPRSITICLLDHLRSRSPGSVFVPLPVRLAHFFVKQCSGALAGFPVYLRRCHHRIPSSNPSRFAGSLAMLRSPGLESGWFVLAVSPRCRLPDLLPVHPICCSLVCSFCCLHCWSTDRLLCSFVQSAS